MFPVLRIVDNVGERVNTRHFRRIRVYTGEVGVCQRREINKVTRKIREEFFSEPYYAAFVHAVLVRHDQVQRVRTVNIDRRTIADDFL